MALSWSAGRPGAAKHPYHNMLNDASTTHEIRASNSKETALDGTAVIPGHCSSQVGVYSSPQAEMLQQLKPQDGPLNSPAGNPSATC